MRGEPLPWPSCSSSIRSNLDLASGLGPPGALLQFLLDRRAQRLEPFCPVFFGSIVFTAEPLTPLFS